MACLPPFSRRRAWCADKSRSSPPAAPPARPAGKPSGSSPHPYCASCGEPAALGSGRCRSRPAIPTAMPTCPPGSVDARERSAVRPLRALPAHRGRRPCTRGLRRHAAGARARAEVPRPALGGAAARGARARTLRRRAQRARTPSCPCRCIAGGSGPAASIRPTPSLGACGCRCGALLRRTRHTAPQSTLAAPERRRNVRGAFALRRARGAAGDAPRCQAPVSCWWTM